MIEKQWGEPKQSAAQEFTDKTTEEAVNKCLKSSTNPEFTSK